jgi:hypothetical protein
MGKEQEIKIRALPRKNEKEKEASASKSTGQMPPRWIIYVGTTAALFLTVVLLSPVHQEQNLASVSFKMNDAVQRYLQDASIKHEAMVRAQEMENMKVHRVEDGESDFALANNTQNYGVSFDQEDTSDRLYRDLNGVAPAITDTLPEDKINARLANRRWVNEFERRERINFVRNFLKSAYDRGYEVQLDQNLVVVGVKKVNRTQKVNIDQIVDRMARQGL